MVNRSWVSTPIRNVSYESIQHERRLGHPFFGRRDHGGLPGQIERIAVRVSLDGLIVAEELLLEGGDLTRIAREIAGQQFVGYAVSCSRSHRLPFDRARGHDARRCERDVTGADIAP